VDICRFLSADCELLLLIIHSFNSRHPVRVLYFKLPRFCSLERGAGGAGLQLRFVLSPYQLVVYLATSAARIDLWRISATPRPARPAH
jgi:hypothetical protein